MSISTSPALARTDGVAPSEGRHRPPTVRSVRAAGIATAVGSATWAAGILVFDLGEDTTRTEDVLYGASGLLFQLGLVALVAVQLATRATGTGTLARRFLHIEHAMLGLAILSSLQTMLIPAWNENPAALALDAFWPLSMLGMCAIGIRIAIAGRWRGPARFWPLGAESWAPVVIPASAALPDLAGPIGAGHLLVGYACLGLVLALRPENTLPRER
ncbi:hypothetical protein [Trujillonella endophytica]|uniref:Uncharacterized protein n=1 Tax=Trujillonella endophytica TaxID=673521 RepID=A0A1H8PEC5_9ACTN|nr:hypothetical protein [Trujillella endophytica]SEO40186.1 hypothetical protein SAMN05660991_00128 [Trujillella endophytica]